MTDTWLEIIKTNVYDYLSTVKYNHPDFNINEFKSELTKIIGVTPAVKIKWNTEVKINELKKASGVQDFEEKIDKAENIEIIFINENNKPIKLTFLV